MKKTSNRNYTEWKATAEAVQKDILKSEEAILWWLENVGKVYDPDIEYPISEVFPLCESTRNKNTVLINTGETLLGKARRNKYSKEEMLGRIEDARIENRLYQDLYWWNLDNSREVVLKIKLKPYMLSVLKANVIEGIRLTDYARQKGYSLNYPHRVMSEIRKLIRKYLKKRQI